VTRTCAPTFFGASGQRTVSSTPGSRRRHAPWDRSSPRRRRGGKHGSGPRRSGRRASAAGARGCQEPRPGARRARPARDEGLGRDRRTRRDEAAAPVRRGGEAPARPPGPWDSPWRSLRRRGADRAALPGARAEGELRPSCAGRALRPMTGAHGRSRADRRGPGA
jgi:hypothetical protein